MALPTTEKTPKWRPIFEEFISELRINSKEAVSVDKRGARLELWGSQDMFLENIASGLDDGIFYFYCVKSRQLGITTVCFAIDLFWLATNDNMMGAFVADTEKNSNAGRATLVKYVESMPRSFVGSGFKIVKNNRDFILFSNGSRLDFLIAGTREKKAWGEGRGYTFCHCTEVANYGSKEGLDSFIESLAQGHPKRLFIFESTTKGFNHWREIWNSAGEDPHTKKRFFIGAWAKELNRIKKSDPRFMIYGKSDLDAEERELNDMVFEQHGVKLSMEFWAWWRWKASDSSSAIQTLHQNQPLTVEQAFVLSGQSFFPTRMLRETMELAEGGVFRGFRYWMGNDFWAVKCEEILDLDRLQEVELRVWEDPVDGASYVIGCDPAWGRNDYKDRTCISVWRCFADKLVQVAEYANTDKDTRQSAWVLAHLAGAYKNCEVIIELTGGCGKAVLAEFDNLRDRMRAEIYQKEVDARGWEDFLATARHYLYKKPDHFAPGFVKSWETNGRTKFEIMNQLRDNYQTGVLVPRSVHLIAEMTIVVQDGSEIGAPEPQNDDRVFAASFANRAYIDDMRLSLISQGQVYDIVMAQENGEAPKPNEMVNNIVVNFFKRMEEREEEISPHQKYLQDRGLI